MSNARRYENVWDYHLPKKTVMTVALVAAFAAMTLPANAQTTFTNNKTIATHENVNSITRLTNTSAGVIQGSETGILNSAQIDTLTNQGTISASISGISNLGTIDGLSNSKSIIGGIYGIQNNGGLVTTLTNTKTGYLHGDSTGIFNSGELDTLTNQGIITGVSVGVSNTGVINSISNSMTIIGGVFGINNDDDGVVNKLVNTATGLIDGSIAGVINSGEIGTLTNQGTLSGSDAGLSNSGIIGSIRNSNVIAGHSAISNHGVIVTLTNTTAGEILGSDDGTNVGISNSNEIDTLTNQGVISARASGIFNLGTIGSISNSGTITGNADAINNSGGGLIGKLVNTSAGSIQGNSAGIVNDSQISSLNNQGAISANQQGLYNAGTIGSISNSGTITGGADAIVNDGGVITYLLNTGTLQGNTAGILNNGQIASLSNKGVISASAKGIWNSGAIGSISNSGTITGGTFALFSDANGTLLQINNSGLIAGNIENDATNDLLIKGASGTIFGTLTGYGNTIGTITNTAANVVFSASNILLNDNINVGSSGYAVNNTDAVLQLNNPVTITGNYTQGAAATLLIGVADDAVTKGNAHSDSGYGRLVVSGSAVIESGSHITLQKRNSYAFAPGQRFVVVDAALAGTNYNADTLIYGIDGINSPLLKGTVVNTASNSDLVVHVLGVSNITATTRNAIALLNGLASYSGVNDEGLLNLFDSAQALNNGTAEEANKAGAQLSPVAQTQSIRVAALPTFDTLNVIGARVDSLRLARVAGNGNGNGGIASGENSSQTGVWGQAFGGHARQHARDQIDGYTANYAGLLLGIDNAVNDQWRAGGAFSYSNTAMYSTGSTKGDATHIDNYGFFGYASFTAPRWYANVSAGVASQHYTENRAIGFTGFSGNTQGSFGGTQWVARGELGYPFAVGGATLTPLASMTYAYLHQNGYTESGGDGAALRVGTAHATTVKTDIGAKLDRAFSTRYGVIVPSVQFAWRHEYTHSKTTVDAVFAADPIGETAFSTQGARPVSDAGLLTAGVTVLRANNLSVTAQYEMQAASGFFSQGGTLRLRQLF